MAAEVVFSLNGEGKLQQFNQSPATLTGCAVDTMRSRPFSQWDPKAGSSLLLKAIGTTLNEGRSIEGEGFRVIPWGKSGNGYNSGCLVVSKAMPARRFPSPFDVHRPIPQGSHVMRMLAKFSEIQSGPSDSLGKGVGSNGPSKTAPFKNSFPNGVTTTAQPLQFGGASSWVASEDPYGVHTRFYGRPSWGQALNPPGLRPDLPPRSHPQKRPSSHPSSLAAGVGVGVVFDGDRGRGQEGVQTRHEAMDTHGVGSNTIQSLDSTDYQEAGEETGVAKASDTETVEEGAEPNDSSTVVIPRMRKRPPSVDTSRPPPPTNTSPKILLSPQGYNGEEGDGEASQMSYSQTHHLNHPGGFQTPPMPSPKLDGDRLMSPIRYPSSDTKSNTPQSISSPPTPLGSPGKASPFERKCSANDLIEALTNPDDEDGNQMNYLETHALVPKPASNKKQSRTRHSNKLSQDLQDIPDDAEVDDLSADVKHRDRTPVNGIRFPSRRPSNTDGMVLPFAGMGPSEYQEEKQDPSHQEKLVAKQNLIAARHLARAAVKEKVRKDNQTLTVQHMAALACIEWGKITLTNVPTPADQQYLKGAEELKDWDGFDIFAFSLLTDWPLVYVFSAIFASEGLVGKFGVEPVVLANFCREVEKGYPANPYHNALHGADVAHGSWHFMRHAAVYEKLTELDRFCLLVASVIHDYGHPGVNNQYLVNAADPIAVTYNDLHVLESFHVAESFKMMSQKPECNILKGLNREEYKYARKLIIELILATDLASHFEIMERFEKGQRGKIELTPDDDKKLMMQLVIKCSDIAHPARAKHAHIKWSEVVTQEFFQQGDMERTRNLPRSMFMDRHSSNLSTSQVGFISFLVEPLFKNFSTAIKYDFWRDRVLLNLRMWQTEQYIEKELKAIEIDDRAAAEADGQAADSDDEEVTQTWRPNAGISDPEVDLPEASHTNNVMNCGHLRHWSKPKDMVDVWTYYELKEAGKRPKVNWTKLQNRKKAVRPTAHNLFSQMYCVNEHLLDGPSHGHGVGYDARIKILKERQAERTAKAEKEKAAVTDSTAKTDAANAKALDKT
eukprot:gb/GEZN01001010.1/.p1 GENE.gb/GEZN01001010.1/~~gb/GEZN01001010.1/.p1  ORF type:complete len:1066 (+),score=133.99 gb/GEZN01001010.1/:121-3318(+)